MRFVIHRIACCILLFGLAGWPVVARALSVQTEGHCPTAKQVETALRNLGLGSARPGWRLAIDAGGQALSLRLIKPGGGVAVTRQLEGRDCAALAEAAAVIVQAHFVSLQAAPLAQPTPPPRPPPTPPSRPARQPLSLRLGLAGGATLATEPAATGQLDLALGLPWYGLAARLAASLDSPTTQAESPDRVQRRDLRLRLELAWRWAFAPRGWLQPAVGGGLSLAQVTALDLAGEPGELRPLALMTAGTSAGWQLRRWLALRLEVALNLLPWADSYQIEPMGEVARSPRASIMVNFGIETTIFTRK